jgi:predicted TIM-barrel enzyme
MIIEATPQSKATLFATKPLVVAALHMPDMASARGTSMARLEDYVLANATIFADAGVPAMMLQDCTREAAGAAPDTVAIMAALGKLLRTELPALQIGIIIQAHDHAAALAVAHAIGAGFVRIKVFVGGVMTAEGPRDSLGPMARAYRHNLRRDDIAILADVHDRTSYRRADVPHEQAAYWAEQTGADGLVITGDSFADSLDRVRKAREAGVTAPILLGGGVTAANVAQALACTTGVIVSRAMMKANTTSNDRLHWDSDAAKGFMDVARRCTIQPA